MNNDKVIFNPILCTLMNLIYWTATIDFKENILRKYKSNSQGINIIQTYVALVEADCNLINSLKDNTLSIYQIHLLERTTKFKGWANAVINLNNALNNSLKLETTKETQPKAYNDTQLVLQHQIEMFKAIIINRLNICK